EYSNHPGSDEHYRNQIKGGAQRFGQSERFPDHWMGYPVSPKRPRRRRTIAADYKHPALSCGSVPGIRESHLGSHKTQPSVLASIFTSNLNSYIRSPVDTQAAD